VFKPLIATDEKGFVTQTTGGLRFVVDSKVKPARLVDQDKTTFVPDKFIFNRSMG
jgi:hypothetical protein